MKRAVLFDLDGTLLDTTEGVLESAAYAAEKLGYPALPHETMLKFVGPPIQDSFMMHYGADARMAQKAAEVFRAYYKANAILKARPYPGLNRLLEELRSRGVRIGVATYKREDYAIAILKHFGIASYCRSMHGADNFNRLTKADIVRMCIEELGALPEETVLVGDTDHDAKGAANAGIDFIAVTFGFGYKSAADIRAYPCIGCVESLERVIEFI